MQYCLSIYVLLFSYQADSHIFQLVFLDNNIAILWSGSHMVAIYVTSSLKGQLCGLCGNYDGIKENDFESYGPNRQDGQVFI